MQCIHYALTRPAVASVLVGYDTPEHVDAAVAYETATEEERDYASVLAQSAPITPMAASAPTAATAPPARRALISPW